MISFATILKNISEEILFGLLFLISHWYQFHILDRLAFVMPIISLLLAIILSSIGNLARLSLLQFDSILIVGNIGKALFLVTPVFISINIFALYKLGKG